MSGQIFTSSWIISHVFLVETDLFMRRSANRGNRKGQAALRARRVRPKTFELLCIYTTYTCFFGAFGKLICVHTFVMPVQGDECR